MPDPKYEGPFESQEEEDLAFQRAERIRQRRIAAEQADEAERKKKEKEKKKDLLPLVE